MEQRTTAWHEQRKGKVTASRIADVLAKGRGNAESLTRAKYRDQLVTERLTKVIEEGYTNEAMQRGTEMEPKARDAYAFKVGVHVEEVGFIDHPTIAMSGASPDGMVGELGLVEFKCPNSNTHREYVMAYLVPEKYKPQMAWQMACTGRDWCDFVSYDDRFEDTGKHLFIVRYERDNEYIAFIEDEVRKFLAEVDNLVAEFNRR